MKQSTITIQLKDGLEARAVAMLVQTASCYECKVSVDVADKKVNAKSIMGMMSLGLAKGSEISVLTDGTDEEAAMVAIENFLSGKGEE